MKQFPAIFFLLAVTISLTAQETKKSLLYQFIADKQVHGTSFLTRNIFQPAPRKSISGNTVLTKYTTLSLDKQAVTQLFVSKPAGLKLKVPLSPVENIGLVLVARPINDAGDFSFGTINNNVETKTSIDQGLHYRGYIDGDSASLACISFFENGEVIGVFANHSGNYIIGKMNGSINSYVVYKSGDMVIQPRYECAAGELESALSAINNETSITPQAFAAPPPVLCKKVRFYWEADYNLYANNFGSNLTSVQNYLTGIFNIVATIYQNEGILIELAKTFVWTTADPYSSVNSGQALAGFRSRWNNLGNNYNADLAHLVAGGPANNGGIAYILNFNQCNRPNTYGYSNVYGTFQSYPEYSWDAQVITHEIGHNLGSNHTHWCGWNTGAANTCGAIDNCFAVETNTTCATCSATTDIAALPPGFKGTIMSYCYLKNGIGINLVNGFGPMPQAAIRSNVNLASCYTIRNVWEGTVSTAWDNTGNWSCGILPDGNTDVIINSGLTNYPVISSTAICRSINQQAESTVKINTGFKLTITAKIP